MESGPVPRSEVRLATPLESWNWLLPASLVVVLVAVSLGNYLLFHILAELLAVIVAVLLCAVAWHTYPFSRNGFVMVLACGFFWIGVIDLLHALLFKGMGVFPGTSANPATQFWLVARFGQALLVLAAPLWAGREVNRSLFFVAFGAATAVFATLILNGHFPDAYVDGPGLTRFKVVGEYVVIAIFALALAHLYLRRAAVGRAIAILMAASIGLSMAAELCFTLYVGLEDLAAESGHVFKLLSYWLLFEAVVRTSLEEPYRLLEARVGERTADLRREVEKRRHAETAIGASESRLRAILEHSSAIISLKDLEGKYLLVNAEFERVIGVGRAEVLGRQASDVVETAAARRLESTHARVMKTRRSQRFEYETALPDGTRHSLMAVSFPVFGDGGALVAVGTISTDISEYKKTGDNCASRRRCRPWAISPAVWRTSSTTCCSPSWRWAASWSSACRKGRTATPST